MQVASYLKVSDVKVNIQIHKRNSDSTVAAPKSNTSGLNLYCKLVSLTGMDSRIIAVFILYLFSPAFDAQSQETFKARSSPLAITTMRFKDAYVKIVYSQPQKRNREIFGELVPYGQVWRTGANEATEITLTKDMMVNDKILKAGTYSIFTIPHADKCRRRSAALCHCVRLRPAVWRE